MPPKETKLPGGFVFLAIVLVAILVLATARLASKIQHPSGRDETEDMYPWATESMKAAYPQTQGRGATDPYGAVDTGRLETIATQESQLRETNERAFDQMALDTQQHIQDLETQRDLLRQKEDLR